MTVSHEGNKIFSFYQDGKRLFLGEIVIPRFVSLWLTHGCNLRCIYCHYADSNQHSYMADTGLVEKLFHEIVQAGIESVEFSGGGEPTLHPDCFYLANRAKQIGLRVGLLTNGADLKPDYCYAFDYIRIGLDAGCDKGFVQVKRGSRDQFHDTIRKIKTILTTRQTRPRVGLKFMLTQTNYKQIEQMVTLSKDLRVDYCHFKAVYFHDTSLTSTQEELARQELNLQKEINPGFVLGNVFKAQQRVNCFMSPIHTVINPQGDVIPCNYLYNRSFGNVFRDGFLPVWYSEKHRDVLNSITMEDCAGFNCRWHFYNAEMYDIITLGKYDLSFV